MLSSTSTLIADGGMGTVLQRRAAKSGLSGAVAPETVLLKAPDIVRSIHNDYIQAGAQILLTCTFASSRQQLERRRMAEHFDDIHRSAARIAREVAGPDRLVVGDLGPLGDFFPPMGHLTREIAVSSYAERAAALQETGDVDALLVETQYDLTEVDCAIIGIRRVSDLPLVITLSFDRHVRTMMGVSADAFAREMADQDLALIGANCGADLDDTFRAAEAIRAALPAVPLWIKPNAGLPKMRNGVEIYYAVTPDAFAQAGARFADLGARVVGGCCGTTPEHIEALARLLRE